MIYFFLNFSAFSVWCWRCILPIQKQSFSESQTQSHINTQHNTKLQKPHTTHTSDRRGSATIQVISKHSFSTTSRVFLLFRCSNFSIHFTSICICISLFNSLHMRFLPSSCCSISLFSISLTFECRVNCY